MLSLLTEYSTIDKAVVVATGNSLVTRGIVEASNPEASTVSMMTPSGDTTQDWSHSGSSAQLNVLANSTVLQAYLIWYSTVKNIAYATADVTSIQDQAITFVTPGGTKQVTPTLMQDVTTDSNVNTLQIQRLRVADVTALISVNPSGTYTVSGVPTSIQGSGLSDARAGWTLFVIYRNPIFTPRYINLSIGGAVATSSNNIQFFLNGFQTPATTNINGKITLIAANGDPMVPGESLLFGSTFSNLASLGNTVTNPNANPGTSPNTPSNNVASGVINNADPIDPNCGLLNTIGTLGNVNVDPFVPNAPVGARHKWDITCLDLGSILTPNQNQVAYQFTATSPNDEAEFLAAAIQFDALAPNIVGTVTTDPSLVQVNGQLGSRIVITNSGNIPATNVTVLNTLASNLNFMSGSLIINGQAMPQADLTKGVNVGTINPNEEVTITGYLEATALSINAESTFMNLTYTFQSGTASYTNKNTYNLGVFSTDQGSLSVNKTVSSQTVVPGDTVTYTLSLKNNGNIDIKNIYISDILNSATTFNQNSVTVGGTVILNADITKGFYLPAINGNLILSAGSSLTITYTVTIQQPNQSGLVQDPTYVTYSYKLPQFNTTMVQTIISNPPQVLINYSKITQIITNNNNYPNINDVITYTITYNNIGTLNAVNYPVLVKLPDGVTFNQGSVVLAGVSIPTADPTLGFTIPEICPCQPVVVTFTGTQNMIPANQEVVNIAMVPFTYQIDPNGTVTTTEVDSNQVITRLDSCNLNVIKTVDKAYATLNSELFYQVTITNTGTIDATNIQFLDVLESNIQFITGSVQVNGVSEPSYNPNTGFILPKISMIDTYIVTFRAKVISVPTQMTVYNHANLIYNFLPDPNGAVLTATAQSNIVTTAISTANLSLIKSVNKSFAQVGDVLTYTVDIQNTGLVPLTNLIFGDNLQQDIQFLLGSVTVNGAPVATADPTVGFSLPTIQPTTSVKVSFKATILTLPVAYFVKNHAQLTYSTQLNPITPVYTDTLISNDVSTKILAPVINVVKQVNKAYATLNDTLSYSFIITNTGNVNATNVLFQDILQADGIILPNSIMINGVSQPTYNPTSGFALPDLTIGSVTLVSFQTSIQSVPIPNVIYNKAKVTYTYLVDIPYTSTVNSNTVQTIVNYQNTTIVKAVDKTYAGINDVITYSLNITNKGNILLSNLVLTDVMPTGCTFVTGSVYADGVNLPTADPNVGLNLTNLVAGSVQNVTFQAKISSYPTTPTLGQLINTASLNYTYALNPNQPAVTNTLTSNPVTTTVNTATTTLTKAVDKEYATVGDILTYTITLNNTGTVSLTHVNLTDVLDSHTTFVLNSVIVNGDSQPGLDPNNGFSLSNLAVNASHQIQFKVSVVSVPSIGYVNNSATVTYNYQLSPTGTIYTNSVTSNQTTTYIKQGQLTITKAVDRNVATYNDSLTYSFVLTNIGNVTLSNLNLTDLLDSNTTFTPNSVMINGVASPLTTLTNGIILPNLSVGQLMTVSFQTIVNTGFTVPYTILNSANVNYAYVIDPANNPITSSITSNTTAVNVVYSNLSIQKSVDKTVAEVNDILTYSFTLSNTVNADALNVVFSEQFDPFVTFVPGTFTVNGSLQTWDGTTPYSIGTITQHSTVTITLKATISALPSTQNNYVFNTGKIEFYYLAGITQVPVTMTSNQTATQVLTHDISTTKTVDKAYATIQDILTYTIVVKNTGTVNVQNLTLVDNDPNNTQFITGSVYVNGVSIPNANPNNLGILLKTLMPGNSVNLSYQVKVMSLPTPISGNYIVTNRATLNYDYQLTPTSPTNQASKQTNMVTTNIVVGTLNILKSVDKMYATVADVLTYTVTLSNTGNTTLSNILFTDILQPDETFNTGTIVVGGTPKPSYNISGFTIPSLAVGESIVVTFSATINTVPKSGYVANTSFATFYYYINPATSSLTASVTSNTVLTYINVATISTTKLVDKEYATINDVLTYTVTVTNTGTLTLQNVNLLDLVPTGTLFLNNSVYINGVSQANFNPGYSIPLNSILPGKSTIITFKATVVSVPTPSLISNTAQVTYSYQISPTTPLVTVTVATPPAMTQINFSQVTLTKVVDNAYALVGDTLTYTFTVANTGNINTVQLNFIDILQSDLEFVSGSVIIGAVSQPTYNPNVGFPLVNLGSGDSQTLSFQAKVIKMPLTTFVDNQGTLNYTYQIDPSGALISTLTTSNYVQTLVQLMKVSLVKYVNKAYATVGDNLLYSLVVKNNGTIPLNNVIITDAIPANTSLISSNGYLGSTPTPGLDPASGINVGTLQPGQSTSISFYVEVTAIPASPYYVTNHATAAYTYVLNPVSPLPVVGTVTSNTVQTLINLGQISVTKEVNKAYGILGDLLIYTVTIKNTGNIPVTNTYFADQLQADIHYITGTVNIDNVQQPTLDPTIGFSFGTMQPGTSHTVMFNTKVITLPSNAIINNTASKQFTYQVDPNDAPITTVQNSNLVTTNIVNPVLTTTKAVDKTYATLNDVLTYTITLNNTGNADLLNAIFSDIPSAGVTFLQGSVLVNGTSQPTYDPTTGFTLGTLVKNSVTTVVFKVTVESIPTSGLVTNKAYIDYNYTIDPQQAKIPVTAQTNTVTTNINVYGMTVLKTVDKQWATSGQVLTYTVTIENTGNVPNKDVMFVDPTPANTYVVLGSVVVNGVSQPTYHPEAGFSLGTMAPNQVCVIVYQVQVK